MHTTTVVDTQKSVVIRGLQYKVGSYISFHTQLFYFFRNGIGIAQEVAPIKRYKEVHLLGVDIPYQICDIKTIHLANNTVKIPIIIFEVPQPKKLIIQISGIDFISLNTKPVYIKENKQIIKKLKEVQSEFIRTSKNA